MLSTLRQPYFVAVANFTKFRARTDVLRVQIDITFTYIIYVLQKNFPAEDIYKTQCKLEQFFFNSQITSDVTINSCNYYWLIHQF